MQRPHFARKLERWTGTHDFVQSLLLLSNGRIVSGGDNGHINVHAIGSDEEAPMQGFEDHTGAVMCLDTVDGERSLVSGSVDRTMRLWDLPTGTCTSQLVGHARSVHCLTVSKASPHGSQMLFTGSRDHSIKLWDMRTARCEHTLLGHTGSVTCIGADGWKLLSGGGYNRGADDDEVLSVDSTLRCWDLRRLGARGQPCLWQRHAPSPADEEGSGHPFQHAPPHGDPVLSLQLLERKVLTSHGGKNWTARIWDLEPTAALAEDCTPCTCS